MLGAGSVALRTSDRSVDGTLRQLDRQVEAVLVA
jgi:hypothetical protein